MRKIFLIGIVMFFLFTISCFAETKAVYQRNRPNEIVGWSISGSDDDIDTSYQLITELDTTYAQLAAEDKIEVLSSAADTTQTVTVTGIDNNGKRISEDIALNGITFVTSTATFRYIDQVSVSAPCTGTVTVRRATGDTFIISIPIGAIEATVVQHFNGEKDSYITGWRANVTTTTGTVIFELRYYPDDSSCLADTTGYKVLDTISLAAAVSSTPFVPFLQPIKCPAGGWITIHAIGGSNNADGAVTIQGYDINPQ